MKKSLLYLFLVATLMVLLSSCTKDEKMATCLSQEESIEQFVQKQYADSTVIINDGATRIVLAEGLPAIAAKGDSVAFVYQGFLFNNGPSVMFSEGRHNVKLGSDDLIPGLNKGIEGMHLEEQSIIAFSAEYGFFDSRVANVPAMSALIYYVTLEKIKK